MKKITGLLLTAVLLAAVLTVFAVTASAEVQLSAGLSTSDCVPTDGGLVVKSEIDPEMLTIVGFAVDAAQNRVLLKIGSELTADVNPTVANFLNITVKKGAEVTVRIEHSESPAGPWTALPDVKGKAIIDRAGADIEVKLNGTLPAQGYFRAKVEESKGGAGSVLSEGNLWIVIAAVVIGLGGGFLIGRKKKNPAASDE